MKRSPFANLTVGNLVALACHLECSAPKVGNVHRGADFDDVSFYEFLISGQTFGNVIDRTQCHPIGTSILTAIRETRQVVSTNTNLGMVLLLVPLARAAIELNGAAELSQGRVMGVLGQLSRIDSQDIFAAIQHSRPGGLNTVAEYDVGGPAPENVILAMKAAADRDLIAQQYANGFVDLFDFVVPKLVEAQKELGSLADAIVWTHVETLAEFGDTLIARKSGQLVSKQAQLMSQRALEAGKNFGMLAFLEQVTEIDFWMRSDGRRRNPGSTADLIAAALFVGLYNGSLELNFTHSKL